MKYMLLINSKPETWKDLTTWSPREVTTMTDYMSALIKELEDTGEYIGGEGLGGPAFMKVVRGQSSGDPLVTDGPMAEAKEFLAGYMAVDVASEERAIEIAARISSAPGKDGVSQYGPIEVHPIKSDNFDFLEAYK